MKLKCLESTDSNGIEQYLIPLGDGSFIAVPKKRIEHRQNGEWIADENGGCRCSVCGVREERFIYGLGEYWHGRGESNYCPNCGAKMRGEDDE